MSDRCDHPRSRLSNRARRQTPRAPLVLAVLLLGALSVGATSSSWTTIGYLGQARQNHTATLLPDGRLLVAGGDDGSNGYRSTAELWNPHTGGWVATGGMVYGRSGHTATLLPDGRVLAAGGLGLVAGSVGEASYLDSAEIWDPATGTWGLVSDQMGSPRRGHTATLLADGDVLLAGGQSGSFAFTSTADLFSPTSATFTATGPLPSGRSDHSATLLADGRVLIVGGYAGNSGNPPAPTYLSTAAIFDPDLGSFTATNPVSGSRSRHTATLLRNGQVLVAAGKSYSIITGTVYRNTALTFNPTTAAWTAAGTLATARSDHGASLLPDGRLLVCGGSNGTVASSCELYSTGTNIWSAGAGLGAARMRHTVTVLPDGYLLAVGGLGGSGSVLTSSERFEPSAGTWTSADDLTDGRDDHTVTLLEDGTVLAAGGERDNSADILASCERYDPAADLWSPTGSMGEARFRHTATRLADGRVLVVGGFRPAPTYQMRSAELYDPETGLWSPTGSMTDRRYQHTATMLADGRVLVVAGTYYDGSDFVRLASAEIYDPATGAWSVTGSMYHAREDHTATLLADGRVLVVGGYGNSSYPAQCELYDPASGSWSVTDSLDQVRMSHTATLLADGRVLVVGGRFTTTYPSRTEVFDPGSETWSLGDDLGTGFRDHTATLLPDGRPLVVGGVESGGVFRTQAMLFDPVEDTWKVQGSMANGRSNADATLLHDGRVLVVAGAGTSSTMKRTAEIYTGGLGFNDAWRPVLSVIAQDLVVGSPATLYGSGLLGGTEAASGGTQSSSSGYPLVQLRSLDNEQILWLEPGAEQPLRDAEYRSAPLTDFPSGPALVTVIANGIPSAARAAVVRHDDLFSDSFESGNTSRWSATTP